MIKTRLNIKCNPFDECRSNTCCKEMPGFQLLILVENSSRFTAFLSSNGQMFHTFPAKNFRDFKPCVTVLKSRRRHRSCSLRKGVLRNFAKFTGKHLCQSLFFNKVAGLSPEACNFIKKETLAQVFSCEFCEISKNTFLTEHLWPAASENLAVSEDLHFNYVFQIIKTL